jgi:hypothetical protein
MLLAFVVSKVGVPIVIYDVVGISSLGSILSTISHILGLEKKTINMCFHMWKYMSSTFRNM